MRVCVYDRKINVHTYFIAYTSIHTGSLNQFTTHELNMNSTWTKHEPSMHTYILYMNYTNYIVYDEFNYFFLSKLGLYHCVCFLMFLYLHRPQHRYHSAVNKRTRTICPNWSGHMCCHCHIHTSCCYYYHQNSPILTLFVRTEASHIGLQTV